MDRVALLQRWQTYNPATGQFDQPRTNRAFAALIGVHESYLSRAYAGLQPVGEKALVRLARTFPLAREEVASVMLAQVA
jgi:hypothetical protein